MYSKWMQFAVWCIQPGFEYFVEKFSSDLAVAVNAFKSATCRLFFSPKGCEMKPVANDIDSLKAFPFLNQPAVLDALKSELPSCLTEAADVD